MLLAFGDYISAPRATKEEIYKKSRYMKLRHSNDSQILEADLYAVRDRINDLVANQNMIMRGGQKASAWLARNTYWMQEITQKPIDRMVWLGAYKKDIDAGGSEESAALAGDAAVRQTQGDTMAISLASGEKGSATIKMFTQFMSWFVMMGSLRADFTVKQPGKSRAVAAAPVLMTMFATMVIGEMIEEGLERLSTEPEDEEEKAKRGLGQTAIRISIRSTIAPLRMFGFPGAISSTVASNLVSYFDESKTVFRKGYETRMPEAPALSLIARALREGKQAVSGQKPFSSESILDFAEVLLIIQGPAGGVAYATSKRIRRGLGLDVQELAPGEERFDASGLFTGRR
tara:strand:+ start:23 stop:1057 length:1035 start_codon:yes stop_codon:yes gene_type:complete